MILYYRMVCADCLGLCQFIGDRDIFLIWFFFFQAEDGIRDRSPSRGLGDVYKRQKLTTRVS